MTFGTIAFQFCDFLSCFYGPDSFHSEVAFPFYMAKNSENNDFWNVVISVVRNLKAFLM